MTTATTIILPATQKQTVANDYTVKSYNPRDGRNSVAFNATLYRTGRKVATFSNDGNGGEDLVLFTSETERQLWEAFVAQHDWKFEENLGGTVYALDHSSDLVFSLIAEESNVMRWLNRKAKTGTVAAKTLDEVAAGQFYIYQDTRHVPAGYFVWVPAFGDWAQ